MNEELVIREIRGRRPRRFRFTNDEFLSHHATLIPLNYKSLNVKCVAFPRLVIGVNGGLEVKRNA